MQLVELIKEQRLSVLYCPKLVKECTPEGEAHYWRIENIFKVFNFVITGCFNKIQDYILIFCIKNMSQTYWEQEQMDGFPFLSMGKNTLRYCDDLQAWSRNKLNTHLIEPL